MAFHPPHNSYHHAAFAEGKFTKYGVAVTPMFDFIVVGGGPAGCALAAHLTRQSKSFTILLIEQGTTVDQHPELKNIVDLPLQTRSLHGSVFDCAYPTTSDDQFGVRQVTLNSGKVLGGSSCINWAIWTRGPEDDYNLWGDLVENDDFSWQNTLEDFKTIETFDLSYNDNSHYDPELHGTSGPIHVRPISGTSRDHHWSSVAAKSFAQSGFPRIADINSGSVLGYGEFAESIGSDGRRSTANTFLNLISSEADRDEKTGFLEVWTALPVTKIMFDDDKRAYGVATLAGIVRAKYEVILTAGAIQSAHLLLLSGVGPSEHLEENNISVVHNSPLVGKNLWDHPAVEISARLFPDKRRDTAEDLSGIKTSGPHLDKWATSASGLMNGCPYEWVSFSSLTDELAHYLADHPDNPLNPSEERILCRQTVPNVEQFLHYGHGLTAAPDPRVSSYIAITNVLLTPRSRGTVSLSPSAPSNDIGDPSLPRHSQIRNPSGGRYDAVPQITLNQLQEDVDKEMMLAILKKSYEILRSESWAPYLERQEVPDDEELLQLVKSRLTTLWHVGGTCAMKTLDSTGVVDNAFRVQGLERLRVADTSVIPFPLAAHTQAIAYVLGIKAARAIYKDYAVHDKPT